MHRLGTTLLFIVACSFLSAAQTYNTPTNVNPIAYPDPIPCPSSRDTGCPEGAPTGAGWTYTEPGFPNTPLTRLTDYKTISVGKHPNWRVDPGGSAEVSAFSKQNDRFYLSESGSAIHVWQLTYPTFTELYGGACVLDGSRTGDCTNNLWFSRATNDLAYTVSPNTNGDLAIFSENFSSTSALPTVGNGGIVELKDLSTCLGASALAKANGWSPADWYDSITVSNDDQTFGLVASAEPGLGNTTAVLAIIWNRTSGCRVYNTGSALGATGHGTVVGRLGPTGAIAIPEGYYVHNFRVGLDGSWAKITIQGCFVGCGSYDVLTYWQTGTLDATVGKANSVQFDCGHQVIGYSTTVNMCTTAGYYYQNFESRPTNDPPDWVSLPASRPSYTNLVAFDMHGTWPSGEGSPVYSTTVAYYTNGYKGIPPDTNAWDGEGLAVATDGSGTVYRLFHTYDSEQNPDFPGEYAIGACNQDFCLWATDWNGMLGNANGSASCSVTVNCRVDVFLAKLPRN